jgi:uncharacterized lipoprotein
MNAYIAATAAFALMSLSACGSVPRCEADADYRKAAAIAPIQPAEGLALPVSPSALRVPELTPAAKAAARDQPLPSRGKGTACLDYPPGLAEPPAGAPVPAAPPEPSR